ncbi:MAG: peroxiredoxin [Pseudomonadota bacterium]
MAVAIDEGGKLPDVDLTTPSGGKINLRDYLGKPLVLYFYPKDDTSGCTREAQDFSRLYGEFQEQGAEVLGVSRDTPIKHQKFIDKYDLTVPLATDDKNEAMDAFGVWVQKSLYGKTYMGIDRSTFLFDARGVLVRVWRKVRVPGHAIDVLEALKELR